jgi:putative tryptophan/tyrosine transport system substrate-binding protein
MKRREFLGVLGTAAAWPLAARAQQGATPVVGFLNSGSPGSFPHNVREFHQGLREAGFVEGRNVAIEYGWAEDRTDRLPAMAADLVRRQVVVIFANGPAALPAKAATATIPIVFATAADPVEVGLVGSLNRPGGNLTGVTTLNVEVGPKQLQLLHELVPSAKIIAVLVNPNSPGAEVQTRDLPMVAGGLGLQLHVLHASAERDVEAAFANLLQLRAGALMIAQDAFFGSQSQSAQLATLTVRYAVPAIHTLREFTAAGGLMSYGASFMDAYRLAGLYTGRILKGEKPGELPVQQATKLKLIINLKTAKALGLEVPPTLLARADEVIE